MPDRDGTVTMDAWSAFPTLPIVRDPARVALRAGLAAALAIVVAACSVAPARIVAPPQPLPGQSAAGQPQVAARAAPHAAPPDARAATGTWSERSRALAPDERERTFDSVWSAVNDRYYDPRFNGTDWPSVRERYRARAAASDENEAFWRTLQRMTAELRDAHTRVHDPRQTLDRKREETPSVGVAFTFVADGAEAASIAGVASTTGGAIAASSGRAAGDPVPPRDTAARNAADVAVASVDPGSAAERAGVQAGDRVVAIDGLPPEASLRRWRERMGDVSTEQATRWRWLRGTIAGTPGTVLALTLEREGARFEVTLPRAIVSNALKLRVVRLASGIGYVSFNRFRPPLARDLRRELASLGPVRGLIVDLRGNGGGGIGEVRAVAEIFLPGRERYARSYTRLTGPDGPGRPVDWTRGADDVPAWQGPVVVVLDERSASGSEILAAALQEQVGARVVGSTSCGCVLGIRDYQPLAGGAELAVSEIGYLTPQGRRLEGTGIVPDVVARPTLADLRAGVDRGLVAAQALLGGGLPEIRSAEVLSPPLEPTTESPR